MTASTIGLLLSLATVGVGGEVAKGGMLVGQVVGPDGRPAPGAEVLASGGSWDGTSPSLLGRALTDAEGRFALELSGSPEGREQPTLWAFRPGSVLASSPVDREMAGGRPVVLILGSAARAAFVVAGPDGRPVVGARVIPRRVAREVAEVPEAVAALASATTDQEGRGVISGFRPEELVGVIVDAPGFGLQPREFGPPGGLADVGSKAITLVDGGRVAGRVTAEDPKSVAGLRVQVVSNSGGRGGETVGLSQTLTDASGRFEVPRIAAGSLTVRVRPGEGSPDLPARVVRRDLESGRSVDVEVPLRRGVRVTGVATDDRDGRPIEGAVVSVVPSGPSEPSRVRTDAQGRYETFVPAGLVSYRVLKVPAPYLCPPGFVGPRPVEVPPGIARFELPTITLTRGEDLKGSVVDEEDRPVGGAKVVASWTMFDGRIRAPRSESATTKADGSFVLGPVAPDAELSLVASAGVAATGSPVSIRGSDHRALELVVVEPEAVAPTGRVVDPEGRPIAKASVRIWAMVEAANGPQEGGHLVRFEGSDELITDEEGRYLSPKRLRRDRDYRALATAAGHLPARGRPMRPEAPDTLIFPDLVLPAEPRRVTVEGRVLDRQGRAVANATVRTSADGPCCRRTSTGLDGRFRLIDVPEGHGFVFVEAAGFRFLGREMDPAEGPLELVATRLDEPSTASMTTRPVVPAGLELARTVITPYADRVLSDGDHSTRIRTLELLARIDPRRVLALIDARGVDDVWFADHLRHAASCNLAGSNADERMAVVEAIRDAEWRVLGALDAVDALPKVSLALKSEWIERALQDSRSINEPARRVAALAKVAGRWIDLGEKDRAVRILDEARPLAESLSLATAGGRARVEFAECLARVDPANALALTENLVDPGAFDRCRLAIARRLASRDPIHAFRVLGSLRDPRSLNRALPAICHALAPFDPALARQLLGRPRADEPCLPAYALGMMALAISDKDRPTATKWLREAFDHLGRLAASGTPAPGASHDPAAVASALLPVAERIDPTLVPELFWRAVSFSSPRSIDGRSDAVLALLLARYDRKVARIFFEPLLDRAVASPEFDLRPLLVASAILDPELAVRFVENLPEAPDLTFHHGKNEARLVLAAALARGAPACWEDATSRFLHLWVDGMPEVD